MGKSLRPGCFKNVNVDNLPVTYRANKKARMTCSLGLIPYQSKSEDPFAC